MEKSSHENEVQMQHNEENDTILVWLDFGPYSYINLAIISELNKLKKFDFIGIVTTRQDLSYFKNQKYISFKKLYYYPECYIDKSKLNIDYLKKIEEEYNLNLW